MPRGCASRRAPFEHDAPAQHAGGPLLPARHQGVYARLRRAMEKVGMRGPLHESEPLKIVDRPPCAEFGFPVLPCGPLPSPSKTGVNALMASGARCASFGRSALLGRSQQAWNTVRLKRDTRRPHHDPYGLLAEPRLVGLRDLIERSDIVGFAR